MDVETGYLYYRRERWVKRRCGMESLLPGKLFTLRFSLQDHDYLYRDINTRNMKPERYASACSAPVILYGFIHQSGPVRRRLHR